MFILISKYEARRRSDTVAVLIIKDANWQTACNDYMTLRAVSGKPKLLGSGGSMLSKLKLKGMNERVLPGVEPAA